MIGLRNPNRRGLSHNVNKSRRGGRRPSACLAYLPQIFGLFVVVSVAAYAGLLIGMSFSSVEEASKLDPRMGGLKGGLSRNSKEDCSRNLKSQELDFESRVEAEAVRRAEADKRRIEADMDHRVMAEVERRIEGACRSDLGKLQLQLEKMNREKEAEVERRVAKEIERKLNAEVESRLEEELEKRVVKEVQRMMKVPGADVDCHKSNEKKPEEAEASRGRSDTRDSGREPDTDDDGRTRRFPSTISNVAAGASLVTRYDFLSYFDYGLPHPNPSSEEDHRSDKEHVLLLYGGPKALPTEGQERAVYLEEGDGAGLPLMTPRAATENCGGMSVVFVEKWRDAHQCTAVVGGNAMNDLQRWLRIDPGGGQGLDLSRGLTPVGRGMQTSGKDRFVAPDRRHAMNNEALLKTYLDRHEDVLEMLRPMARAAAGDDGIVVVMVCNSGQAELLANFACSAEARGFGGGVKDKVLLFATDKGALDVATGLGLTAFYDEELFEEMQENESKRHGEKAFGEMMWAKVVAADLVSRLGHDVLFQDVDLVWYRNPLRYLRLEENRVHDVILADDGSRLQRYGPYMANTGFYFARGNDKTRFLLRSMLHNADTVLSASSHQQAMAGFLAEHSSLTGLRVKTMAGADFPGGYHYHSRKEAEFMKDVVRGKRTPYLIHMSWTEASKDKIAFLQQMGCWYVADECRGEGILATAGDAAAACCSAKPLIKCHYKDKPSVDQCIDSSAPMFDDKKGRSFW